MSAHAGHITRLPIRYPELAGCLPSIQFLFQLLTQTFHSGGKLLVCGNGGSAADSEHMVGELMKGFLLPRSLDSGMRQRLMDAFPAAGAALAAKLQGALPAIALVSQSALLSAIANDTAAEMIFAQQVYGYGQPGDALLAISTSGNSVNVLHALRVARVLGLHTLGLSGRSGGALAPLCDAAVCVPWDGVMEIQERHLAIYHALCADLEEEFFGP